MSAQREGSYLPDKASNLERGDGALGCLALPLSMLLYKSILHQFGGVFRFFECQHGIFGESGGVSGKGATQPVPGEESLEGTRPRWCWQIVIGSDGSPHLSEPILSWFSS